mgnify:CR=1 FL=1
MGAKLLHVSHFYVFTVKFSLSLHEPKAHLAPQKGNSCRFAKTSLTNGKRGKKNTDCRRRA